MGISHVLDNSTNATFKKLNETVPGLALVRRTLAAAGGTLTAENDGGAVFTAILPLRRQAPDGGTAP